MLSFIQKYCNVLILGLVALLGLCLGHLAANGLALYLQPPLPTVTADEGAGERTTRRSSLRDYDLIVERNVFNSRAPARKATEERAEATAAAAAEARPARGRLKLQGTVAGGADSLALIEFNGEAALYHLDERLPDDRQIIAIARHEVTLRGADNTLEILPLEQDGNRLPDQAAPPASPSSDRIRAAGDNRWIVDREVAENARNNIGQLLRSARMVPNMVGEQTEGFVVKMIRPRSLLDQLGLREGDVVMQVNGMELSSPEKALRVFQQLREAEHIAVDLMRGGTPLSIVYEIN